MSLSLTGDKHKSRGFAISTHVVAVALVAGLMGLMSTVWVQQDGPWKLLSFRLGEHTDMRPMVTLAQVPQDAETIVIGSADFLNEVWERLPEKQTSMAPVHLPQPDRPNVEKLLSLIDNRGMGDRTVLVEMREEFLTDYGRPGTRIVTSPEMGATPFHAGAIRTAFATIGRSVLNGDCCEPLPRPVNYEILQFEPIGEDSPLADHAASGKLVLVSPPARDALDLTNPELRMRIGDWIRNGGYIVVPLEQLSTSPALDQAAEAPTGAATAPDVQ